MRRFTNHFESAARIGAQPSEIFNFVDDHERFSSHMSGSSWMMGGGSMKVELDAGRGQQVGSHIRMEGSAFAIPLSLDEVILEHDPPRRKVWETVGDPRLLVIGNYRLGVEIRPEVQVGSSVNVFIDYDLPSTNRWLGRLFGKMYARWCVGQMLDGIKNEFKSIEK